MALACRGCFGPDYNDDAVALFGPIAPKAGITMPATFDGVAPPDSAYWLVADNTAPSPSVFSGGTFSPAAYTWLCARGWRLKGTLPAAAEERFLFGSGGGGSITLYWVYVSANTYQIKVVSTRGGSHSATTVAAFNTGQTYALRMECNGTTWKLWVDSTLELTFTELDRFGSETIRIDGSDQAGVEHGYSGIILCESDSESDRPDHMNIEVNVIQPTGDTAEDDYWDEAGSGGSSGDANWSDVDLSGTAHETVHGWQGAATSNQSQTSSFSTLTPTAGLEIIGVTLRVITQATGGSKTVATNLKIQDASANEVLHAMTNMSWDNWRAHAIPFHTAPDGGAWQNFDLDDFRAGVEHPSSNNANDEWALLIAEVAMVGNDAPAAAAEDRRHLMAQVI